MSPAEILAIFGKHWLSYCIRFYDWILFLGWKLWGKYSFGNPEPHVRFAPNLTRLWIAHKKTFQSTRSMEKYDIIRRRHKTLFNWKSLLCLAPWAISCAGSVGSSANLVLRYLTRVIINLQSLKFLKNV